MSDTNQREPMADTPHIVHYPPGNPDARLFAEHVAHLRAEIDRLTADRDRQAAQVRAEQEHNRRLAAACSLYRSAAVRNGMAMVPYINGGGPMPTALVCRDTVARGREETDRADDLVLPTAG